MLSHAETTRRGLSGPVLAHLAELRLEPREIRRLRVGCLSGWGRLVTVEPLHCLQYVRSQMHGTQPTEKRANAAERKELTAASPLSPTALAEARAGAAEAELLAMLELEEARADDTSKGKPKGKAKSKASKR